MFPEFTLRNMLVYCIALLVLTAIFACSDENSAQRKAEVPAQPSTSPKTPESSAEPAADVNDWPMFMHDISYLGVSPDKVLRPPLSLVWKFKTGGPVNSSPVVADGTVYVGSDDGWIYALYADKWGVKWQWEAGDRIMFAPTVYEGSVYFSARNNKAYALDAATGEKKWEFQADGWINSPVVAFRGGVYLGCYDKKIYVLDSDTGKVKSRKVSSVQIGNFTYICSEGEMYPMDSRSRAKRWRDGIPISESWPATANGVVYIGSRNSKLYAFDHDSHKEIWNFQTDGWVDSSPAVAKGMIYFGSRDGYVYALGNPSDQPPQQADNTGRKEGVVVFDKVKVYDQSGGSGNVIALLNKDMIIPMANRNSLGWYRVILPDDRSGWISKSDFIPVRWFEELQVNDLLVKDMGRPKLPKDAEKPNWSPDGKTVVFFDNIYTQSLYWKARSLWSAAGNGSNPRWVADGSLFNPRISWSGNSDWFAFENLAGRQRQVWMVRANGTGLRKVTDGEAPAISPGGGKLAFIDRKDTSRNIWVRNLRDNEEEKIAEILVQGDASRAAYGYTADLIPPAWSPDESRLAVGLEGFHYSDNYARVAVISTSGGIIREIAVRSGQIGDAVWSPDGKRLAFVSQEHSARQLTGRLDKTVHLVDMDDAAKEYVFEHSEGITWSPDGRYMAFIEENDCMGIRRKVWLLNMKSRQRTQLLATKEDIYRILWTADNRIILITPTIPSETLPKTRVWIISITSLPG